MQRVNAVTGIPYCQFLATNVVLDKTSEVKLLDIVSKYGFATVDGYLGHIEGEGDGVYAWVHSRKSSAKTLVSTQTLVKFGCMIHCLKKYCPLFRVILPKRMAWRGQ